jgi:hypothetical protein
VKADDSSLSRIEVYTTWSSTFTHPYAFTTGCLGMEVNILFLLGVAATVVAVVVVVVVAAAAAALN